MNRLHRLFGIDWGGRLGDDVPRIQLLGHIHDGDTGLLLPVEHRPIDGGSPPVLGEQGGVHIDAPLGRQLQNFPGQETAVGRHYDQLRGQLADLLQGSAVLESNGLENRNIMCKGYPLYRWCLELHSPVFRPVRLGEYAADGVSCGNQRL